MRTVTSNFTILKILKEKWLFGTRLLIYWVKPSNSHMGLICASDLPYKTDSITTHLWGKRKSLRIHMRGSKKWSRLLMLRTSLFRELCSLSNRLLKCLIQIRLKSNLSKLRFPKMVKPLLIVAENWSIFVPGLIFRAQEE